MNFEDKLLVELKAEMAERATREAARGPRRFVTPLRLGAAAALAAVAVSVPLVLGGGAAAYAVTRNPDGTLTVTVKELQDAKGLQATLNAQGVRSDVTYTPRDKKCAPGRFVSADHAYGSPDPRNMTAEQLREWGRPEHWRSKRTVIPVSQGKYKISPNLMRSGETLVLEFRLGNDPRVGWSLGAYLAKPGSPVRPCVLVDEGGSDREHADEMAGRPRPLETAD
ncbi:hypothetical protein ABGB17_07495 [Sphaerisporangium sp. B11E5]|uniref:hypothetical protein n=1 Tax=Sphaerisporangium sp. B11E5 TaxID=3153563 RepID=UPI00325F2A2B